MNNEELIFALDIGTRTVIGIVGYMEGENFKVVAAEIIEHKSRSIFDGQVSDIQKVAETAGEVKKRLENKIGGKLSKVAIAAAGRVLKTQSARVDRNFNSMIDIKNDVVTTMEIEAVQLAQKKLDEEISANENEEYYCVGYTVTNYYLNEYVIKSLIDQRGDRIGVEILGTFLPQAVIDSLYSVMKKIGLEVVSLTLEPIAAINAAIPGDIRMLNLALVDIGAGTSDIAITKGGSVIAYSMVSFAGDEITERICENYVVDFNTAEKIKLKLTSNEQVIDFTDVLGFQQSVAINEVMEVIRPIVEELAGMIVKGILNCNKRPPNAVFLVGGGSQIPEIAETIAEKLNLPSKRVAVRGRDVIKNLIMNDDMLMGPDAITPIGIAVTSTQFIGQNFIYVYINDEKIRLFNSKKLCVADALIIGNLKLEDLMVKIGDDLNFYLNGNKTTISGELGCQAQIYVNEKPGNLRTKISQGDSIVVIPAVHGSNALISISGIKEKYFQGDWGSREVIVNEERVEDDYIVQEWDSVDIVDLKHYRDETRDIKGDYNIEDSKTCDIKKVGVDGENYVSGELISVTVNDNLVNLKGLERIFLDIFNYIDLKVSEQSGNIVLKLNGLEAGYTDLIKDGDVIQIYWH